MVSAFLHALDNVRTNMVRDDEGCNAEGGNGEGETSVEYHRKCVILEVDFLLMSIPSILYLGGGDILRV